MNILHTIKLPSDVTADLIKEYRTHILDDENYSIQESRQIYPCRPYQNRAYYQVLFKSKPISNVIKATWKSRATILVGEAIKIAETHANG